MYKLYFSNKYFTPNGIPKEKVPFLVKEDMSFEEIPTLWFFDLAINSSTTTSPETWRGYAEAIVDFFNTCEVNKWSWKDIEKNHLIKYRNNMVHNKNSFGRPYSKSTINNYLTRICLLYEWCVKKGYIKELPFEKNIINIKKNINDSYMLSHLNQKNSTFKNELILKQHKTIPHCLTPQEIKKIFSILKERDTLIVKWSVLTGMRKKEVLALTISDIPNSHKSNSLIVKIPLTVTKGEKPRSIFASQSLIDETNRYIKFTRRVFLKKYPGENNNALWLNERNGLPISKKGIEKNFREAVEKANVKCTFHHLRHTYAIKMLSTLTKQSKTDGLNPLKTLQLLLGHSSINTTMVYLEALSIDLNEIQDSLIKIYGEILDEEI